MSAPVEGGSERRTVQRHREYAFDEDGYGNAATRGRVNDMQEGNAGDADYQVWGVQRGGSLSYSTHS